MIMTTRYDIEVQQGANFALTVQARNVSDNSVLPLVGYSAKLQVRATVDSPTVLMEASTGAGTITINGPAGIVSILVPATTTETMTWNTGVYDLEVSTSTANVLRLLEGFASLSLEVTV